MAYAFTATLNPGYLYCRATGDNSAANIEKFLDDVLNACRQKDCNHALLEDNFIGPSLPVADIYRVISHATKKTWPYVKRIAFMDENPEHSQDKMRFAETVARNRGVVAKFFTSRNEAIQWLLNG